MNPGSSPWWVVPKENPSAKLRLICFPYAGGGQDAFRYWPDGITDDVEVVILQQPGRGNRFSEAPISGMGELIDGLMEGAAPLVDKPFAFFGHSMGGLVSFELACELKRRSMRMPEHLFASASRAPQLAGQGRLLHLLPDDELIAELREKNGTPEEILNHRELMELLLPMVRADFAISETYVNGRDVLLECGLTLFTGERDRSVRRKDLLAWKETVTGAVDVQVFPGDHFFIHSHCNAVIDSVNRVIAGLLVKPAGGNPAEVPY